MSRREFKYKQVIVVRTDLKMSKGKTAVQVAHGSLSAAERVRSTMPDVWRAWFREGQKKVAVKARSEDEIQSLLRVAVSLGIPHALIKDAGMTELEPGTMTVLGIGPDRADKIDRVTGELKLL